MSRNKVFSIVAIVIITIALATVSFADVNVTKAPKAPKVLAEVCDLNQPTAFADIYGEFDFDYKMTDSTSITDSTVTPHVTTYTYTDSVQVKVDSSVVAIDTTFHCEEMLVSPETLYRLALDTTGNWVPSEEYLKLFSENFKDFDLTKLDEKAVAWQKRQEELKKAAEERKQFVADSLAIEMEKAFFNNVDSFVVLVPNDLEELNEWMDPYNSKEKFAAALVNAGFDKKSAYVFANTLNESEWHGVLFNTFTNAVQMKNFARHVKRNYVEVSGPTMDKQRKADRTMLALIEQNTECLDWLEDNQDSQDNLNKQVQEKFAGLDTTMDELEDGINNLDNRVNKVEEKMTAQEAWNKKMQDLAGDAKYNKPGSQKNKKRVDDAFNKDSN